MCICVYIYICTKIKLTNGVKHGETKPTHNWVAPPFRLSMFGGSRCVKT